MNHKDKEAYQEIVSIYERKGQLDVATDYVLELIKFSPQAQNYRKLGFLYLERRMLDDAIQSFQKAGSIDPTEGNHRLDLGFAYFLRGYMQEAIEEFNSLIAHDPQRILPYFLRALCYYKLGQFIEARQDCQKIMTRNPRHRLDDYTQRLLYHLNEVSNVE